jgi:hypothetical protein
VRHRGATSRFAFLAGPLVLILFLLHRGAPAFLRIAARPAEALLAGLLSVTAAAVGTGLLWGAAFAGIARSGSGVGSMAEAAAVVVTSMVYATYALAACVAIAAALSIHALTRPIDEASAPARP